MTAADLATIRATFAAAMAAAADAADRYSDACGERMQVIGETATQAERSDLATDRKYASVDAQRLRQIATSWGWRKADQ